MDSTGLGFRLDLYSNGSVGLRVDYTRWVGKKASATSDAEWRPSVSPYFGIPALCGSTTLTFTSYPGIPPACLHFEVLYPSTLFSYLSNPSILSKPSVPCITPCGTIPIQTCLDLTNGQKNWSVSFTLTSVCSQPMATRGCALVGGWEVVLVGHTTSSAYKMNSVLRPTIANQLLKV